MEKTRKKATPKTSAATPKKKDRHSTPVIVTTSGQLVAGKRRIAAFVEKHGAASVALHEFHHFAMLPFLRVAKDEEGKLHLTTTTTCDEEGWDLL